MGIQSRPISTLIFLVAVGGCGDVVPSGEDSGLQNDGSGGGDPDDDASGCTLGQQSCGSVCIDVLSSPVNCGSCGNICTGGVCLDGVCQPACPSGTSLCGVGCMDVLSDGLNCGSCGHVCQAGAVCVQGSCECENERVSCGGICVNTASSASHCGMCGTMCGAQVCSAGMCADSCGQGETQCGQDCVDIMSDGENCGACGETCVGGTCEDSECICGEGRAPCDGICTDLGTDDNCGACGDFCEPGEVCTGGVCLASSGGGDSVLIDEICYPLCAQASNDPDGDGWGWENQASCVVLGSVPYQRGTPCSGGGTGGAAGTGGTAGSGGNWGSGGSGTGGCSVSPANPNTNEKARKVLCYLHEIYGQNVLSGQQDCHWSASSDLGYINNLTGEYPAIVGGDFLYTNAVSQAISSWNAGGLSMIRYHMGRPEDADSYESSLGTTNLADTLTPGSARYNGLMAKFNHAASELSALQNAGVVVIWAPFHETQPNGWFWWSKGTGTQLKQLWQLMFDNFKARGLNNLIWLFPFSGQPNSGYYPGPASVDIAGPDTYGSGQPFVSMYNNTVSVVGSTMPIPLHETGNIPHPGNMFQNNQAPWVLFNAWCDTWLRDNSNSVIQNAYSHQRTLNRADLPDFN